jgi:hypothetical protein
MRRSFALDETGVRPSRDDVGQLEPRSREQTTILLCSPLASAIHDEHVQVQELYLGRLSPVLLFRTLATLRADVPVKETLAELEWQGADGRLKEVCHRLGDDQFPGRVPRWRTS